MSATFFTEADDCSFTSLDEISDDSVLGGGNFTRDNISELLSCFRSGSSTQNDNLWLLSTSFSQTLSRLNSDALQEVAANWAEDSSWEGTSVNPMDLAGHLLEIKYAYSGSGERIWVLFD